ncbi:hypothetical protein DEU56DRAFT_483290 [Suillus clintonianus]|uniref:uncharacterized protein n=1 Tax=Suillus clintonianus TaxID=1904413 RepID=UPI001B86E112|nr:uncharacterized protein DEU56DRAFT_483290 [Suillus clintonianus]KAG2153388.1 hypothetical protein DEU56DRAFT_483290 [Suillus clintonianus]
MLLDLAIADVWEWIPKEAHPVGHDPPFDHVGAQDHGLVAPDISANGQGLAPAPVAPSARTLEKGMNVPKREKNTNRNVHAPVQVLYQVCRTLIRSEGVVRRKTSTAVVRRRGKEREKRKKRKHGTASGAQWGKYGIISETDFYNKTQEFRTWLLEERKINPESISKDQERKEFAVFIEDYNTATLPHEKYYHMEAYERRMTSLRAGEFVPPAEDSYDPEADLRAHSLRHKKTPAEHESYLSKEELMELRKVQSERVEVGKMKLLGMEVKQNMGVRMDRTMFDD